MGFSIAIERAFGRALVFVSVMAALFGYPAADARHVLDKNTALLMASYRVGGVKQVPLAIVTKSGKAGEVAREIESRGGRVQYIEEAIGFIALVLPIDEIGSLVEHEGIEALDIDWIKDGEGERHIGRDIIFSSADPNVAKAPSAGGVTSSEGSIGSDTRWPPRPSRHPFENPHSVLRDLGAERLLVSNPTFDGRGIVIGHVENFHDFLHPDLQIAYGSEGEFVPKLLDIINPRGAEVDADGNDTHDWQWARLSEPVMSNGNALQFKGTSYRVPKDGSYRIGRITIPNTLLGEFKLEKPLDDGAWTAFDIAWSDQMRMAWLDTNRDSDFSNERALPPYRDSHQFGTLGIDDPKTSRRESIGFAIQWDQQSRDLSVNFGRSYHATLVAGAMAANGVVKGVAPGAQIIQFATHLTHVSYARSVIAAFADPRTDAVMLQVASNVGGIRSLKDGRSTDAILVSRLVERYRKPIFVTGGNDFGLSSALDACVPSRAACVGAYTSGASLRATAGATTKADLLHKNGAEGPAANGAFKPDFLAPSEILTVVPQFSNEARAAVAIADMPLGYAITGGTSTATPVGAGAAAIIMSAAKQSGLSIDAELLMQSLRLAARHLSDYAAYEQGSGVMDVEAAWNRYQKYIKDEPPRISAEAPVRTMTSHMLAHPHRGVGLYEREGWQVGDREDRVIYLTRETGSRGAMTFDLSWRGSAQAVFSTDSTVSLPLGKPVPVRITVALESEGVHSVALQLSNSRWGVFAEVPVTVVAAARFTASDKFSLSREIEVPMPGRKSIFFEVPFGVQAFNVRYATEFRPVFGAILFSPDGRSGLRAMYPGVLRADVTKGPRERGTTVWSPMPGVWELRFFEASDFYQFDWWGATRQAEGVRTNVVASVFGARLQARTDNEDPVVHVQNEFAPITGGLESVPLGSLHKEQISVRGGEQYIYQVQVPDGADFLFAGIDANSSTNFDADLYAFYCDEFGSCRMKGHAVAPSATERLVIGKPKAGLWKIVIDTTSSSAHDKVDVSYFDVYTHAHLGALGSADVRKPRESGASWAVRWNAWQVQTGDEERRPAAVFYLGGEGLESEDYVASFLGSDAMKAIRTRAPLGLTILDLRDSTNNRGLKEDRSTFPLR